MSRNKNGLIRKRNCVECGMPTRKYRLVTQRKHEWVQAKREWLPNTVVSPVCMNCLHLVEHLDTVLYIKSPELEVR